MSNITLPAMTDSTRKSMTDDAANARAEARIGEALAPYWDSVLANNSEGKRGDVVKSVLTDAGLWKDTPQKDAEGKRTAFGNVVQRFGARYDAAVKRAKSDDTETVTDWIKLVRQAAENAHNKGEYSPESILAAVADATGMEVYSSDSAGGLHIAPVETDAA